MGVSTQKRKATFRHRIGDTKKRRQQKAYNSDSGSDGADEGDDGDFHGVNLLDSDDDIENAQVEVDGSDKDDNDNENSQPDSESSSLSDNNDDDDDDGSEDGEDLGPKTHKSKRNDPDTFSTSLHKILGTKLSTSKRSDPVLSRSAAAHEASRRIVDTALEEKARRQLRLEKRAILEKGRVKDVLVASNRPSLAGNGAGGDTGAGAREEDIPEDIGETTADIIATEKRLRKVAQRGVVKLFNAVRAAQVKASEMERAAHKDGVLGIDKREAKVTEMSRKGFLDLIASGGGALKKDGLQEA